MGRALAGIVAAALLVAFTPVAPAGADARADRAELLLRIAELTDRLESAEADVVAAQFRGQAVDEALQGARARLRERAVLAYIHGGRVTSTAMAAPAAYLDVAAAKEQRIITGFRAAAAEADRQREQAESVRGDHRRIADELDSARARLDATIAADDARRAEELRQADEARARTQAARAAELAAARGRARAGAGEGGYVPNPLDPDALLPRHHKATQRQLELMRRWPFGPLPPGDGLPPGLRATGQRIEGPASWYGPGFDGRPTASGAIYDQEAFTVASKELPLGTFLVVSRGAARVLLLVNDRGPYIEGRVLDLSHAAAVALGVSGVAPVTAEVVAPG